ncbi:MAG TPA: YIP1 family protein [Blastocatellia bacterium]|jgi:hypothetical protein|nr:YIP1 family protein [Blastocatellia bacterium]
MSEPEIHTDSAASSAQVQPFQPTDTQEPAKLGPVQRLTGVLLSPGETFQDINRKPTWLAPIIIGIVVGIASSFFLTTWVNPDWNRITREMIRKQGDRFGGQAQSEEQIRQQVRFTEIVGKYFPLVLIIMVPIAMLVVSGVFALGMMLMQAQTTFKKIMSVVTWSFCGTGLVGAIVNSASIMVKDQESLDAINPMDPGTIGATHIGAFLPSDTAPALKALASSLDLFSFWTIILLSIGLAAIGGSKRITTGKTATLVVGLWLVWVLFKVLSSAVFGG